MYASRSNLILGFHGCEKEDQEKLLNLKTIIKKSDKNYDWLGHGMYFWENNEKRAFDWANQKKRSGTLKNPASIGAVLSLGNCLDLFDTSSISILKNYYTLFVEEAQKLGFKLPENENHPMDKSDNKVLRKLDCAVIEYMHSLIEKEDSLYPIDSIRAAFIEGGEIYPGAGFNEKTHIQICIRNPNCIKGFFLPRKRNTNFNPI